ncbi:alkaline phosphatase D family protein [Sphingomonas solaris]|uniref:Alkaline phosphatase n=1 Tax=Alterirhizorhabdus solaris TaxID=2529389 RepID=A0A558R7L8_9SPHN|nr:alkaline phosphatase D family protein [Sphingomonas solaris]TVV75374.1 alkaline phosphatase [Sphingomonas solaris]
MIHPALTRRTLLTGAGALLAGAPAILRAQITGPGDPFPLGVAAGDPAPDGFVIWTRLAPDPLAEHGGMPMIPVPVQWEVSTDPRFTQVAMRGEAIARPELAHAVHIEVTGLAADRPYYYRFTIGRERSLTGRARTAPPAGSRIDRLRIASVGCQHYEDGLYTAYRHLAGEDVGFVFHYGDYIYEGRGRDRRTDALGLPVATVRRYVGDEIYDLADYRRRYAQTKLDPDLQAAHAMHAFVATFDDHEIDNNWTGDGDQDGTPPEIFLLRRQAALQAWYEHMPVRRASLPHGPAIAMARRLAWGDLADFRFLDTRQFRTRQPCGDGFGPACPGVESDAARVLDPAQQKAAGLPAAGLWTVFAQQVMMMTMDRRRTAAEPTPIMNLDTWAAYARPREQFLASLGRRPDVIVLTGDEHQNFAGEVRDKAGRPVAIEFVATSITSGGDGQDRRAGSDVMLANNPHLKFINDQRGYVVCDIGREGWNTDYMVLDRVSAPGGTLSRRIRMTVPRGETVVRAG